MRGSLSCRVIKDLVMVLVAIPLYAYSGMQSGALSQALADANDRVDAMERIRLVMYQEIRSPTARQPGGGYGHVYHDYQMLQIVTTFHNLLAPPRRGGRTAPAPEDVNYMIRMLENEKEWKAKDVFKIVLTFVGVQDYADNVVELIEEKRQGQQVRRAAINALRHIDYAAAIPVFIEALTDTSGEPAPYINRAAGTTLYIYPAQRAAAYALRDYGVPVQKVANGSYIEKYEADRDRAASVLASRLEESCCEKQALLFLHSIIRLGGEGAIKAVQNYIRENDNEPEKQDIIAESKRLLHEFGAEGIRVGTEN